MNLLEFVPPSSLSTILSREPLLPHLFLTIAYINRSNRVCFSSSVYSLACWKLAPALACGNVIVVLPSPETPLSVLYLAPYFEKAGFPASVYNVLPGKGIDAGAALSSHLDVDKVSLSHSGNSFRGRSALNSPFVVVVGFVDLFHWKHRYGEEDYGGCR